MSSGKKPKKYHSLSEYLMLFIVLILIIASSTSLVLTYILGGEAAVELYDTINQYSAENAETAIVLVSRSLDLFDAELNPKMERVLVNLSREYVEDNGDFSRISLEEILSWNQNEFNGTIMLKVLNPDGVIIYSTVPEDLGLDFRTWPEIYRSMEKIRKGVAFVPDRVTVSLNGTVDTDFSGQLSKYVYLPSPDHRYLFAMGLSSAYFEERGRVLSYQRALEEIFSINPDLLALRLYHRYKPEPIAQTGSDEAGLPPAQRSIYVQKTFVTGQEQKVNEEDGDSSLFMYIPIQRTDEVFDNSLVLEHVVSKAGLKAMLFNVVIVCLLIMLVAILVGALCAYVASKKITRAFNRTINDITIIADGDLDHAITGASIYEFDQLETNINTMVRRIRFFSTELERKEAELTIAATIQRTFLPKECPDIENLDVMMYTTPAREVGGDFYDFITLGEDRYGIVIADVSGKGVPAALFMALSRTVIRENACWYTDPAVLMNHVNNIISENTENGMFVTVFYGIIDMKAMTLSYCNAGHNPPVLFHFSGNPDHLPGTGIAVGAFPDMKYTARTIPFSVGDTLLCYTDGITEAIDSEEQQYGEGRLISLVQENQNRSASDITQAVCDSISVFCGSEPQFDDITIMVIRMIKKT